ncbi:alkyl sulfatase dimerization domain-containing protein [Mycobacterium montefiorense]|uniref:MBL fold hydrolase n=1 Tax=Mycobacterium montefiorense TaxID=154654 RepID=A0AA37PQQ0_9MYCO|nr:alkyl sulfatase dimerization domain-containing protein [Mycobacterium montefiorense]GBG36212.1 MBL fold hydrolase [Mycobacterium montefiorense]GKU33019.1 MBL fold hydrolase [Mycobacterium montefiorense]GKU38511.1 MBL fold hydrolase [Mycobacterium montefiorense]GKU46723.1 MBL fold hydrolase [Mycobacterium montefiorense]GKU51505.1 MBL fold hydrolase [Mycobacterium montefiorense]
MAQSLDALVKQGNGDQDAVDLGDGIFMSRNIANSYLVTTADGNLLINTGTDFEANAIKERFARASTAPLRAITFTQGHPDHVGGWDLFNVAGVQTIAQANHPDVREYWRRLHPFYARRITALWGAVMDVDTAQMKLPPEPVLTTTFVDNHAFELGGRCFELYSTPGGETTDALVVWMPEHRTVFVGNLMGPFFGHVPNLYTLRGDKIRSAMTFLHSLDRVIALAPETLINGHEVFRGADQIRQTMTKVRAATAYLREATIEGMNAGDDLWTLMRDVRLPPELALPQVHGKVAWIVRAIWEEHVGWFRYESTTELYDTPLSAVWGDIIELTGGTDALIDRARIHVEQGRALQALHLIDIVLHHCPQDTAALRVKKHALECLLESSGRENFSEVQWLKQAIKGAAPQDSD